MGGATLDDVVAPDVGIVRGDSVLELLQGDAVALHPRRVGMDLVAFHGPPVAGHVSHARQAAEQPLQRVVLQRLEVVGIVDVASRGVLGANQHVAEDLAGRRPRRDIRGYTGRKVGQSQTVEHLLPGLGRIGAVFKLATDVAQLEQRLRAGDGQPGHACQGHLQRDRHLPLDLLGRRAGIAGYHLDNGWCRIGIGLDVHLAEGVDPVAQQRRGQQDHHQPTMHSPTNQTIDHRYLGSS